VSELVIELHFTWLPGFNAWFVSESFSIPRLLHFHGYAWFVTGSHPHYWLTGFQRLWYRLLCGHITKPSLHRVT